MSSFIGGIVESSAICVIERMTFSKEIPMPEMRPAPPGKLSAFGTVKVLAGGVLDFAKGVRHLVKIAQGEDKVKSDGFSLFVGGDDTYQFPYGNKAFSTDSETQALNRAVDQAAKLGFNIDQKSLSMFSNGKIDRLTLTKASTR